MDVVIFNDKQCIFENRY